MPKSKPFHILLPPEAFDDLARLADRHGRNVADEIREALQKHMVDNGYKTSFKVKHGGKRQPAQRSGEDGTP